MARDWIFQSSEGNCHFRCAAVITRNGKILMQRDSDEYALIGGHVQVGETGEETVVREFQEELSVRVQCRCLLWTEECFWTWQGVQTHTISFYYHADFCEGSHFPYDSGFHPQKDNPRIEVGWVPYEKLNNLTVYPDFLKQQIFDLKPGHFITRA